MTRLFIDSDGVFFDMEGHIEALSQKPFSTFIHPSDKPLWDFIETVPEFWRTMPLMTGAVDLMASIRHLDPVVLTGCPRSGYANAVSLKTEKWNSHFPGIKVLTCPSRYKPLAAAVYLGLLPKDLLDDGIAAFLHEIPEAKAKDTVAYLKGVMADIDLGGAVLVDDLYHNIKRWRTSKGNAVWFRSNDQALHDLSIIFEGIS